MTTTTTPTPQTRSTMRIIRDTFGAELSKILTLPAVWLTLAGALIVHLVITLAFANAGRDGMTEGADGLDVGIAAVGYSQLGFILLGVIVACSEYIGGQIRTTLIAMPRRATQRLTATAALALVTFVTAAVTLILGVVVTSVILGDTLARPDLGDAAVVFLNTSASVTLMTLIGAAVGVLFRRAIPAAAVLTGYLLIVSPLLLDRAPFARYLPDHVAYRLWGADDSLATSQAWLILILWTLAAIAASTIAYGRRDT